MSQDVLMNLICYTCSAITLFEITHHISRGQWVNQLVGIMLTWWTLLSEWSHGYVATRLLVSSCYRNPANNSGPCHCEDLITDITTLAGLQSLGKASMQQIISAGNDPPNCHPCDPPYWNVIHQIDGFMQDCSISSNGDTAAWHWSTEILNLWCRISLHHQVIIEVQTLVSWKISGPHEKIW